MLCPKCGYQNSENARYCTGCGSKIIEIPVAATTEIPKVEEHKEVSSSEVQTGLSKNVAGLLCYLFGWITGIIFYVVEKDKFVRFHAMQSIVTFGAITVINIIVRILMPLMPIIMGLLNALVGIGTAILWILLMVKAYQNEMYKLPFSGDLAEKYK